MTTAIQTTVLGQFRWASETIEVVHLPDDTYPHRHGGYNYALRASGGKIHPTEIRCNTEDSAWKLFGFVLAAIKLDVDVSWLFSHGL